MLPQLYFYIMYYTELSLANEPRALLDLRGNGGPVYLVVEYSLTPRSTNHTHCGLKPHM